MPAGLARTRLRSMLRMTDHLRRRFPVARERPLPSPNVVIDPDTGLVTVEVEIFIARPIGEVAQAIAPPNWDEGGRFFQTDGCFLISADQARCLAAGRSDCGPPVEVQPPSGDYDWAVLYEHFHAEDADGLDSTFTNLLWVNPDWITTPKGERMYIVAYTLYAPLGGRVGSVEGVKILRDDGELGAKELRNGHTRVRMRKHVRFESQWANIATYIGFRAAQEDLDDQFRETASARVTVSTNPAS
jgi:hypothetical protein